MADEAIRNARHCAGQALREVRRSVGVLRNSTDGFSLPAALAELVSETTDARPAIELQVSGDESDFPVPTLTALYHAVQESLTNVYRHADASHVVVQLSLGADGASLRISDDGRGFDPALLDIRPNGDGRFGLRGVRERVELVGGSLRIDSTPAGGTCLLITVPRWTSALAQASVSDGGSA